MQIYLASKSPRRQELLKQMDVAFELLPIDTPEIVQPQEKPEAYSRRITKEKLRAAWQKIITEQLKPMPTLCADTEVVMEGAILGKPQNKQDAFNMLKGYVGKTHQVLTSVGLIYYDYEKILLNRTLVTFSAMSDEEINHYLAQGSYQDRAGAYAIQSYIGQFISHIDGCFYSVMGLSLNTVRELLRDLENFLDKD